jgi:hypothetical protein
MRTTTITITINTPQAFDPYADGQQWNLLQQIDDVLEDYPVEFEDWQVDVNVDVGDTNCTEADD